MSDTHNSSGNDTMRNPATVEELQAALAESHADNEKLRATVQRTNARMSVLTEENENLRKERDVYKQQLEALQGQHATELREVTEEMAAAARFSDNEWRAHCDRVEEEGRRLRGVIADVTATALELLPIAEAAARQRLQNGERAKRRGLQGRQWKASLKKVREREAAHAEAVFAARGLSMSELRRTHLGKERTTGSNSYAAGKGLYNLFLALLPGGIVDSVAMRELLKEETDVTVVGYTTPEKEGTFEGKHFAIPSDDADELAACVLRHLPAPQALGLGYLPPLSTCGLEWVSHLPMSVEWLNIWHTDHTVADLRELHRRRGGRTFRVVVHSDKCTDWGEYAGLDDVNTKKARVNEELGGMMDWV